MNRRVVRRGPVKLTEDDKVVPADTLLLPGKDKDGVEVERPVSHDTHSNDSTAQSDKPPQSPTSTAPSPTSPMSSWSGWFSTLQTMGSNLRASTAEKLDRIYELANQPVPLGQSPPTEVDRAAAVDSLDLLISRAKGENTQERTQEDTGENGVFRSLDKASDALGHVVAAGLSRLKSPEVGSPTNPSPLQSPRILATGPPVNTEEECPVQEQTQLPNKQEEYTVAQMKQNVVSSGRSALEKIGSLAGKAREQLAVMNAVDRSVDRSVDEAFKLYNGSAYVDAVQKRGQEAGRNVKRLNKKMTPKVSREWNEKFRGLEDEFDSERIMESVVLTEESCFSDPSVIPSEYNKLSRQDYTQCACTLSQLLNEQLRDKLGKRHRVAQLTSIFCQMLSMADNFGEHKLILQLTCQMIAELQLLADEPDAVEDTQYCAHLVVDCAYHLLAPVKLQFLQK